MTIRFWPKRTWLRVVLVASLLVLAPYGFSRLASPWRCVSVHSMPGAEAAQTPTTDAAIRIACWNIAHGRGLATSNWKGGSRAERIARLDRIAETLREIDANVVVLNEVDFDSSWSFSVNQARYLAEKAGYSHWAEQRNLDFRILLWKWRFGNAVLSKCPIPDARVADLPGWSTWETILAGKKRGVICGIVVGSQPIRVVGAHLSPRGESLRVRSAIMLKDIAGASALPTIVAGDLNSTPPGFPNSVSDPDGDNAIKILDKSGCFRRAPVAQPVSENHLTFPSVEPRSVIDWILIPHDWRFPRYDVELSKLSDHRPVSADAAPASSAAPASLAE